MKDIKNLTIELKDLILHDIYTKHISQDYFEGVNLSTPMYDTTDETMSAIKNITHILGGGIVKNDINDENFLIFWKVQYKTIECVLVCEIPSTDTGGYFTVIQGVHNNTKEDFETAKELWYSINKLAS